MTSCFSNSVVIGGLLHVHVIVVKLVSLTGSDVGWREGETHLYRRGRAYY